MSDPLKSTDIEDVLSSIRRLVSEETGERPAKGDAAPGNSRLVLTPALRVNEAGPDEDHAQGGDQDDRAGDPPAHTDDGAADDYPDVTIPAQPEAGDAPATADAETDAPVTADAADVDPTQVDDAQHLIDAFVAEEVHRTDAADMSQSDGTDAAPHAAPTAHADAAQNETRADQPAEEPAGDDSAPALDWEDHTAGDQAHPQERHGWSGTLYDAARAHGTEPPEQPAAQAPRQTPPTEETTDTDARDEAYDFLSDDDDAVLDEEALRELVAEIVRQELQGALGERITRNVRKLVRREIHRALSAQEFD
jgi:hypothetical protein